MGKMAEQRWWSEGEDWNRVVAVWEVIDSDNKIYLISLNKQLYKEKRANKQNMWNNESDLSNLLSWPIISKSTIYNITVKPQYAIMVHCGFKYCGLITHHSSSQLGNSMSSAHYGLAQPSMH
jgi:hypothetical protein